MADYFDYRKAVSRKKYIYIVKQLKQQSSIMQFMFLNAAITQTKCGIKNGKI